MENQVHIHSPPAYLASRTETVSCHRNSPISSMPVDILLEIFGINANMNEDGRADDDPPIKWNRRAMNTTRYCSQVSSFWRDIIINAPILWGGLIDLNFLHRARVQWHELVMGRAKKSLLHVKGTILLKDFSYSRGPDWIEFIKSNWKRIRQLDLDVISGISANRYSIRHEIKYQKCLAFLSQPTSTLQSFSISLAHGCNLGSILFDNCAPQLRHFESRSSPYLALDSAWFSQLQTLKLQGYTWSTFRSVDVLYQFIARMERLEVLFLDNFTNIEPYIAPNRLPLRLSRLKYLRFHNVGGTSNWTRSPCWLLMDYIIPKPGCSIQVLVPDNSLLLDNDCLTIARLANNYFQVNRPKAFTLSVTDFHFTICDIGTKNFEATMITTSSLSKAPSPSFVFFLRLESDIEVETLPERVYQLIKGLSSSSFPEVADLYLTIEPGHQMCFKDRQFGKFLYSFTFLTKLVTDPHTFYFFLNSPFVDISTIFPLLSTLEITLSSLVPLRAILPPFLLNRQEAGVPLSTFEYRFLSYSQTTCIVDDFSCLEDVVGLKVVWWLSGVDIGEYICGSGSPQALNFRKKWARAEGLTILDDEDGSGYLTDSEE